MSNYTKTTNFASKDNLSPGNPLKIVKGTEIDTEFNNIQTAVGTKTDNSAANITGGSITGITDLAVADGGTGASTATAALNNLLPTQTGNANKYLQTDGTNATWDAVSLSTSDITGTLPVANGGTGVTSSTGTGSVVLSNSPTLVTPALGTPASGTATNLTGLPISTGVSGLGTGVATFLGTPSSANLASAVTDETGSGALVFANSPTLVTPALGTPSALVGTNITGTASGLTAGNVTTNANLTGAITSTGNATSLGSFSSANLLGALTDETGTGANVFATSPTLVTPILGTPTSATLTNATGLPISTGVSGLGTGVATALAVNVGSSGAPLVNGGVLGTPSSGTATNLTGLPLSTGVTGTLPIANGGTNATDAATARTNLAVAGTGVSNTFSANQIVSVTDNTNAALRITQLGTGNALLVEDSTNPDASPFVIDASGNVLAGLTTARTTFSGGAVTPAVQIEQVTGGRLSVTRNSANATSVDLFFGKTRGTSIGAVDSVISGDGLGNITWQGADGTNLIQASSIASFVDGTPGTNDMPGRLVFATTADGASSPTERVRIASTGAIGLSGANYGTSGQVLTSGGSSATPTWTTVSGGGTGDVVGPASSTDNAFTRFDGTTGKLVQNSTGATLSDTGAAVFTGALDVLGNSTAGSNIKLYEDTDNGTNYVAFKAPDTIAANVTWTLPSADGTSAQVLSTNGSGTLSWATAGGGSSQWTTTGSDIYYNTGKVGIGTTAPFVTLDVRQAAADCVLRLKATSGVTADKNTYELRTVGASGFEGFQLRTVNDANNSYQNVLQFNPTNFLHVSNNGSIPDGLGNRHYFTSNNASNPTLALRADSGSLAGTAVLFIRGNRNTTDNTFRLIEANNGNDSGVFAVRDSGNVVNTNNSYGSSSDVKLKQDIIDASSQWDDIKNVRVRKYRFKNNPTGALNIGVVAQELETVSAGLVESEQDYEEVQVPVLDSEGNPLLDENGNAQTQTQRNMLETTTKSVKYSVLYMKAVKALQEAMTRIEQLEARLDAANL